MEHIINPIYNKKESIEQLQKVWNTKEIFPHLVLTKFLTIKVYAEKEKEIKKLRYTRESRPDIYSYAQAKTSSLHLLDNKEIREFIATILNKKIKNIFGKAYYFSWKDYTLLNKKQEPSSIDIIFDCTEEWKEEWGGAIFYKNNKGRYLKFLARPNTLLIIERKNSQKYIQYVNNLARGKKRYILLASVK